MKSVCITWKTIHQHGDLWAQHLRLRKALFVDERGWQIPHSDDMEWDQYDTALTRYVITHDHGRVLSASRLNPCDFESAGHSYMIRDAVLGRLAGIPADILASPPVDPLIWEATRFTVDPGLPSDRKTEALEANARALAEIARSQRISGLIALMPPAFVRWLTRIGLPTERIGPITRDREGAKICVISMDLTSSASPLVKNTFASA